jgi:hypothetical protein
LIENHFIETKSRFIEGLFIESHFIENLTFLTNKKNEI